jgi:hypothetical protein
MPKPVFIICCESGTEDKYTGMASLFNIIDRIVGNPLEADTGAILKQSLAVRIVAVWEASEQSDFEGEFNIEMRMLLPSQDQTAVLSSDTMRFTTSTPRHRSTIVIGAFRAAEAGQLVFESRVKRSFEVEWISQAYSIDVVLNPPGDFGSAPA